MKKTIGVVFGICLVAGAYFIGPSLFMCWEQWDPSTGSSQHFPTHFYGSSHWLAIAGVVLAWRTLALRPGYPESIKRPSANSLVRALILVPCSIIAGMLALLGVFASDQYLWIASNHSEVFTGDPSLWLNLIEPIYALINPLGITIDSVSSHLTLGLVGYEYPGGQAWAIGIALRALNFVLICRLIQLFIRRVSSRVPIPQGEPVQAAWHQARIALFVMLALIAYFCTPVSDYAWVVFPSNTISLALNGVIIYGIYDILTLLYSFGLAWFYLKGIGRYLAGFTPESVGPLETEDAPTSWPPAPKVGDN